MLEIQLIRARRTHNASITSVLGESLKNLYLFSQLLYLVIKKPIAACKKINVILHLLKLAVLACVASAGGNGINLISSSITRVKTSLTV